MTTPQRERTAGAVRARPHLHCAPVPDGVYVSSARNRLVLRGWGQLHTVLDRCLPLLERGTDEDELVAGLGSERARPVVRWLTGELRRHGMLLDPRSAAGPVVPEADRRRYAETLTHLEAHCADPEAAFAAIRAARVVLAGPEDLVGPARRVLERAGVGEVVVTGADAPVGDGVDVTVRWSADPADPADPAGPAGPSGAPVVPVRPAGPALLVGPVVTGGDDRVARALVERVRAWAGDLPPVARPLGDALAGALAAHLVVGLLAGLDDTGPADPAGPPTEPSVEAHVVYGAELASDRLAVAADPAGTRTHRLDDAPRGTEPRGAEPSEPSDVIEAWDRLRERWTGLLDRSDAELTYPALPVMMRAVERRAEPRTRSVAWAADQAAATTAVSLAALRRTPWPPGPTPDGPPAVGAAGTSRRTWLLDGALRLLAAEAGGSARRPGPDPERDRLERCLAALGVPGASVALRALPGFGWSLAEVRDPDSGVLAAAWGPDPDTAARDALSAAVAREHAAPGGDRDAVEPLCTAALDRAGVEVLDRLRDDVRRLTAAHGATVVGERLADPVLGDVGLWFGPVRFDLDGGPR